MWISYVVVLWGLYLLGLEFGVKLWLMLEICWLCMCVLCDLGVALVIGESVCLKWSC